MNTECNVVVVPESAPLADHAPAARIVAPRLYMFYLGGSAGRCNIELHDIQFAAAYRPEDAWPGLREAWFGDKDKVHLDGYTEITWADGHEVSLREPSPVPTAGAATSDAVLDSSPDTAPDAQPAPLHLYFVYAGGYRPDSLAEQHDFGLFVAPDAATARKKAMQQLLTGLNLQHKDSLKDVDNCLLLDSIDGWRVTLRPQPDGQPDRPLWQGYQPIGS